ncbi:hypothetical protein Tco_0495785 [Tanacetum coccineum]
MDDLYNNLKVYEFEIKVQSSSSLNSQNVAFVSSKNTSSTNEAVNTAHEVSTASSQGQTSSSTYVDDVIVKRFLKKQLKESENFKWQEKLSGFDKTKVEGYNKLPQRRSLARECRATKESKE